MKNKINLTALLMGIVLIGLLIGAAHAAIVPTTKLYIIGNATPADFSPQGQTVVTGGTPTISNTTPNAPFGNPVIVLNGITDYVQAGMVGAQLGPSTPFYLGFWVNETPTPDSPNGTYLNLDTNISSTPSVSGLAIKRITAPGTTNSGFLQYKLSVNGTQVDITNQGTNILTNNTPNYISCTRSAANGWGIACYVNGTLDTNITLPAAQGIYWGTGSQTIIGSNAAVTNLTKGSFSDIVLIVGDSFNAAIQPSFPYYQNMPIAFTVNHTYINPCTSANVNLINVSSNVADITATNFTWSWGDPLNTAMTALTTPTTTGVGRSYTFPGIYAIQEQASNTYFTSVNHTFVIAVF